MFERKRHAAACRGPTGPVRPGSGVAQRELQAGGHRPPHLLAGHPTGQGVVDGTAAELGERLLRRPDAGVAATELGLHALPELRFLHGALLPLVVRPTGPSVPPAGRAARPIPWAIATPSSTTPAPSRWCHASLSPNATAPTTAARTGTRKVTTAAPLAPSRAMLRTLIAKPLPGPTAPSSTTDTSACGPG